MATIFGPELTFENMSHNSVNISSYVARAMYNSEICPLCSCRLFVKNVIAIFLPWCNKPSWPRLPHYRGIMITLRYTILGRTPLNEWSARDRDLYPTKHNSHVPYQCCRRDLNLQSQQASGRRPTTLTARPQGSTFETCLLLFTFSCSAAQRGLWPPAAQRGLWPPAAKRGLWPPRSRGFLITQNDVSQSVWLLWTNDQHVAETSTWQHTTNTTNIHVSVGFKPKIAVG
jgi:hypothetical protein